MFPKSGRILPDGRVRPSKADYRGIIRDALRAELGGTHVAAKTIMRWTGASDRTARNWLHGEVNPSGYHLVCLAAQSEAVLTAVLTLAGRLDLVLTQDVHAVEVALAQAAGAIERLKRQRAPG